MQCVLVHLFEYFDTSMYYLIFVLERKTKDYVTFVVMTINVCLFVVF